jgi:hypothetical protein
MAVVVAVAVAAVPVAGLKVAVGCTMIFRSRSRSPWIHEVSTARPKRRRRSGPGLRFRKVEVGVHFQVEIETDSRRKKGWEASGKRPGTGRWKMPESAGETGRHIEYYMD